MRVRTLASILLPFLPSRPPPLIVLLPMVVIAEVLAVLFAWGRPGHGVLPILVGLVGMLLVGEAERGRRKASR